MSKKTLEDKIAIFNSTYGAKLDLPALEHHANQFKYLDKFLFEKKTENPERTAYIRGLGKALLDCVKVKLEMNANGNYDLSNFYIPEFIQDYEEIVAQKNNDSKDRRNREPFEGADFKEVVKMAGQALDRYNKDLASIWTDRILKDEFSVKKMREMTNTAQLRLFNAMQSDNERARKKADGTWNDDVKNNLRNLIIAKQTMEKVRKKRGIIFAIFSFKKNAAEKEYLAHLTAQIAAYRTEGLPVAEVTEEASASALKAAYANAKDYKKREAARKAQRTIFSTKAKAVIFGEENKNLSKEELRDTPPMEKFKEELEQEMKDRLPTTKLDKESMDLLVSRVVVDGFINMMQTENEKFDQAIYDGEDPKKAMEDMVKAVFTKALSNANTLGYQEPTEQAVAAQVIVDIVLNKFSPAAFDKENYGEYANAYALNNPKMFEKEFKHHLIEPITDVPKAKQKYSEMQNSRENIQVDVNNKANEQLVEPVQNVAKINEIRLNKN